MWILVGSQVKDGSLLGKPRGGRKKTSPPRRPEK